MQTIGKLLGRSQYGAEPSSSNLITTDRLGVEIELEGFEEEYYSAGGKLKYWILKEDNSLRNGGIEFVTRGGFGGKTLESSIIEMDKFLTSIEFNASWRCSTHMHINMLDCSIDQACKVILAYMCVENIMFDFCAPHRRHSNFCVPLTKSTILIRDVFSNLALGRIGPGSGNKYMAFNTIPLGCRELGTLEFRGSHALVTTDELLGLANRLLSIKNFAVTFQGSPDEMLYSIETGGWKQVLSSGVHEGYIADYELFEKSVMSAWSCLKRYQKVLADGNIPRGSPISETFDEISNAQPIRETLETRRTNFNEYMRQAQTSWSTNFSTASQVADDELHAVARAEAAAATSNHTVTGTNRNYSQYDRVLLEFDQKIASRYWESVTEFGSTVNLCEGLYTLPTILRACPPGTTTRSLTNIIRVFSLLLLPQIVETTSGSFPAGRVLNNIIDNVIMFLNGSGVHLGDKIQECARHILNNHMPLSTSLYYLRNERRWGNFIFPITGTGSLFSVYKHLSMFTVRLKNRNELRIALDITDSPLMPEQMPAIEFWNIMQTHRLNSERFIYRADLNHYRKIAAFLSMQLQQNVLLPKVTRYSVPTRDPFLIVRVLSNRFTSGVLDSYSYQLSNSMREFELNNGDIVNFY